MKIRTSLITLTVAICVAAPAFAQPHPPDDHHRAAEIHREDEHHAAEVHREDEHRAAVVAHRETEEEERARLLRAQDDARARRQIERKDERAWEARRDQRALEERNAMQTTWGPALDRPEARAELTLHADRMARLNRILDVAQDQGNAALVAHTQAVIQKEINRDARILHSIRTQLEGQ